MEELSQSLKEEESTLDLHHVVGDDVISLHSLSWLVGLHCDLEDNPFSEQDAEHDVGNDPREPDELPVLLSVDSQL